MRNCLFMKIIKWTYFFTYRYDLCKEKIFFNNTDVWRFFRFSDVVLLLSIRKWIIEFSWLSSGLTTKKFSADIVRPLSKRNRFSIGRCAKFVGHFRWIAITIIPHPVLPLRNVERTFLFSSPVLLFATLHYCNFCVI